MSASTIRIPVNQFSARFPDAGYRNEAIHVEFVCLGPTAYWGSGLRAASTSKDTCEVMCALTTLNPKTLKP